MDIDEEIAIAEAEEEVMKEQEMIHEEYMPIYGESVRVGVDELIRLNMVENDLDYLLKTIRESLRDDHIYGLRFDEERVINMVKLISPTTYKEWEEDGTIRRDSEADE